VVGSKEGTPEVKVVGSKEGTPEVKVVGSKEGTPEVEVDIVFKCKDEHEAIHHNKRDIIL